MNDGNESGKDGGLVCTGMIWSQARVKDKRPFQTRRYFLSSTEYPRDLEGHSDGMLATCAKKGTLQGTVSDVVRGMNRGWRASCKGQAMICDHAKQTPLFQRFRMHESRQTVVF